MSRRRRRIDRDLPAPAGELEGQLRASALLQEAAPLVSAPGPEYRAVAQLSAATEEEGNPQSHTLDWDCLQRWRFQSFRFLWVANPQ